MLAEGKVEIGTAGSVKAHVEQQILVWSAEEQRVS